jgi:hypothetical protein
MGVVADMKSDCDSTATSLPKLAAFILLGGSVRPGRLSAGIGRPIFELPLQSGCTILDRWRQEANSLAAAADLASLPLRVMIDRTAAEPVAPPQSDRAAVSVSIERDPFDYRGTGGVLRDLAGAYGDDDVLVVANAAQVLLEPLTGIVFELAEMAADVAFVSYVDGTVGGIFLVRCAALRNLPAAGFVDMKEQALPAIARSHTVKVLQKQRATALPIRMLSDYTSALRRHHRLLAGRDQIGDPFDEDWEPAFAIAEDGAQVDASARLHDSVVLRGGRVEADAVLVHSIVCPGGVLRRRQMQVDDLVEAGPNGRRKD